jgi:hypothetical protein
VGRRVGRIGVGRTVGILGNLGRTVHQTIVDVYSSVLCSSRDLNFRKKFKRFYSVCNMYTCVATKTYNTVIVYIQNMSYIVIRKCFIIYFMILAIHKFCYFNLIVSLLHCNHQYHADFGICHDLYGLIIGEYVPHLPVEVPSYIVRYQAHTTIHACLCIATGVRWDEHRHIYDRILYFLRGLEKVCSEAKHDKT